MALNAYLKLKGQKQGDINGSVTQKAHEGAIAVVAVDHSIVISRDPATGGAIGRRMHKPFVITKEVDQSSPRLYTALVTNETLVTWRLDLARPSRIGSEGLFYTILLTDATIASIHFAVPEQSDPEVVKIDDYEEIAFVYRKIEWTFSPGNVTASDDWEAVV
jgi:type VI secretion system secreted protein Hcp